MIHMTSYDRRLNCLFTNTINFSIKTDTVICNCKLHVSLKRIRTMGKICGCLPTLSDGVLQSYFLVSSLWILYKSDGNEALSFVRCYAKSNCKYLATFRRICLDCLTLNLRRIQSFKMSVTVNQSIKSLLQKT